MDLWLGLKLVNQVSSYTEVDKYVFTYKITFLAIWLAAMNCSKYYRDKKVLFDNCINITLAIFPNIKDFCSDDGECTEGNWSLKDRRKLLLTSHKSCLEPIALSIGRKTIPMICCGRNIKRAIDKISFCWYPSNVGTLIIQSTIL